MISFSSTKFAANRRPNGRRFRSVTTAPRRGNATKSVGVFAGKTLPPAAPTTFFFLFYPPPPPTSPLRVWEEKKKKKKKKRKKKSSFPHLALQRRSTRRERPSETVGPRFRPVTFFFVDFVFPSRLSDTPRKVVQVRWPFAWSHLTFCFNFISFRSSPSASFLGVCVCVFLLSVSKETAPTRTLVGSRKISSVFLFFFLVIFIPFSDLE